MAKGVGSQNTPEWLSFWVQRKCSLLHFLYYLVDVSHEPPPTRFQGFFLGGGFIFNEFLSLDIIAKQCGPMAMILFSNSSPGLRPQTFSPSTETASCGRGVPFSSWEEIDSWIFVWSSVLALGWWPLRCGRSILGYLLLKAASGGLGAFRLGAVSTEVPSCWLGCMWAFLLQWDRNSSPTSGSNLPGGPHLHVPGHFSLTTVTKPDPQLLSASTENELLMSLLVFSLRPASMQAGRYLSP